MGKKRSDTKQTSDRRAFLKGVLVSGGAAAVAVAGSKGLAAPTEEAKPEAAVETGSKGYRETAHIREYYKIAGF